MVIRNELMAIAAKEDAPRLIVFMQKQAAKTPPEWEEVLSGYSRKELEELWQNLLKIATSLLLGLETSHDSSQAEMEKVLQSLECLIVLATATVISDKLEVPPSLLEMSILLHDLMPSLPDTKANLKNLFSQLFEMFWIKEKPGREYVYENTLRHLFQENLKLKSTLKMMKRLWKIRSSFASINFDDPLADPLKELISESLVSGPFMKKEEGVRVLGSVMPLNVEFMKSCHEVIKKNLVNVPKHFLPKYGRIYFQAWQLSNEEDKSTIETAIIQDIMYNAIHASGIQLVKDLRKILAYIHRQKKQKGVAVMLHRLYAPLLWRSLKAANSVVRLNSLYLFIDVFPIQNTAGGIQENNDLLQNQFNTFDILLMDPCPSIRSRTIVGVCQMLSAYWQMIPKEVIKSYITTLIEDLAWDSSSAEVRESVLKGIMLLFDCHYCHQILQPILPELQNLFHDSSERVRIAMVNLLIKVKSLRKVKFWSIVPVEHLLARLASDSDPVARRIMKTIFNSYLPLDKPVSEQIFRTISLIESNPQAARVFFHHAPKFMTLEQVESFILLLCSCILRCIRDTRQASEDSLSEHEISRDKSAELEVAYEGDSICFDLEKDIIRGFLDAIIILWTVKEAEFAKPANHKSKEKLNKIFAKALSIMTREYKDPQLLATMLIIAGKLPSKLVPYLSHRCLSKLQKLSDKDSVREDFSALIQTTCSWGHMKGLLDLIKEWLTDGMKQKLNSSISSKQSRRNLVRFREEVIPKPSLALKFMLFVIEEPNCRSLLIKKNQLEIIGILEQLKFVLNLLEERLSVGVTPLEYGDDEFLQSAYYLYIRINLLLYVGIHSHEDEASFANLEKIMKQFCTWAQNTILPVFNSQNNNNNNSNNNNTLGATKKRNSANNEENTVTLSCNLLEHLFTLIHTYLLMFRISKTQYQHLSDLFHSCFTNVHSLKLLPIILKCLVQIVSINPTKTDGILQSIQDTFVAMLENIVTLATVTSEKPALIQIFNMSRLEMSNILSKLYEYFVHKGSTLNQVYQAVLEAIFSEHFVASEQSKISEVPSSFQDMNLVSLWLLNIIFKKSFLIRIFYKELHTYIRTKPETFENLHRLHSLLYVLSALTYNTKASKTSMKDVWLYVKQSAFYPSQATLDNENDLGIKICIKENISHLNLKLCDQVD
ncbi:hypothetical protein Ahia01_000953600 [Argonauta hians]